MRSRSAGAEALAGRQKAGTPPAPVSAREILEVHDGLTLYTRSVEGRCADRRPLASKHEGSPDGTMAEPCAPLRSTAPSPSQIVNAPTRVYPTHSEAPLEEPGIDTRKSKVRSTPTEVVLCKRPHYAAPNRFTCNVSLSNQRKANQVTLTRSSLKEALTRNLTFRCTLHCPESG